MASTLGYDDFFSWKMPQYQLTETTFKEKEQPMQFILWSPSGYTNPKVVFSTQAEAQRAADSMALKLQKEFFVCKLVTKTVPAPKTITTTL
jgi:hypothetical protein